MERNKDIENTVSRKRLKKKVLERWENEGGKVCDVPTMAAKERPLRERANAAELLHEQRRAETTDGPSAGKRKPGQK